MRSILVMISSILFLLLMSCEKEQYQTDENTPVDIPESPATIKYLALGDSYTIGTSVAYTGRFPKQLIEALRDSLTEESFEEPGFVARNGWTTTNLINTLENNDTLQPPYDLVSLLIGVNNQFQNLPFSRYAEEFPELLSTAIELAGGDTSRVFVVSIPDYAFTPFGQNFGNPSEISEELDEYNNYNRELSESWGVSYFNITPISRDGLEEPSLVASDGLHPSGTQYGEWVRCIVPGIIEKL